MTRAHRQKRRRRWRHGRRRRRRRGRTVGRIRGGAVALVRRRRAAIVCSQKTVSRVRCEEVAKSSRNPEPIDKSVHKSNRLIQKLTYALRWNQSNRFIGVGLKNRRAKTGSESCRVKGHYTLQRQVSCRFGRAQSWAKLDGRVVRVIVKISYRLGVDSGVSNTSCSCCSC